MNKISVLIVDDSALVRSILTEILSSDPGIEVVGVAKDPLVARQKIKDLDPDVITLDVEMPKMDGISFLRNLMRLRPMPVIMISSLTDKGAEITLEALSLGAVDFISKPKIDIANELKEYTEEIIEKVKIASTVVLRPRIYRQVDEQEITKQQKSPDSELASKFSTTMVLPRPSFTKSIKTTDKIIAIGASTGGTEAVREILEKMPPDTPGILISQHIPPVFSKSFAGRMNEISPMTVFEVTEGQPVIPGHVYVAPGDRHLLLVRDGARYRCELDDGKLVNRHKPSVDVLFRSVAENSGSNAIGVILTGMGEDGARGLHEMCKAGARTIAQDEKTSIVWGMPGEAVKCGAAQHILPLEHISGKILELCKEITE
jgi:two-component system chemotaxis response regulator CheB